MAVIFSQLSGERHKEKALSNLLIMKAVNEPSALAVIAAAVAVAAAVVVVVVVMV